MTRLEHALEDLKEFQKLYPNREVFPFCIEALEKLERLEDLIPKDTIYCHSHFEITDKGICAEPCPFWAIKHIEEGKYKGEPYEYCYYLGERLSIEDQVKDCGISEGWEYDE